MVIVLLPAFSDIHWTEAYWTALGLTVAKSVLTAIVAYFARFLIKPVGTNQ